MERVNTDNPKMEGATKEDLDTEESVKSSLVDNLPHNKTFNHEELMNSTEICHSTQKVIGCATTPNTIIRFTLYSTTFFNILMSRHICRHFCLIF